MVPVRDWESGRSRGRGTEGAVLRACDYESVSMRDRESESAVREWEPGREMEVWELGGTRETGYWEGSGVFFSVRLLI